MKSFDASSAKKLPGVRQVLEIPSGIAVLGEHTWAALEGRKALQILWDDGPHAKLDDARIRQQLKEAAIKGTVARDQGNPRKAFKFAATTIDAEYEVPYLAHAPMEPVNCTAEVGEGGCELWVGTQAPTASQKRAAEITGLPPDKVQVHTMMLGGGFGRRSHTDFVADAVHAAKAAGKPVQILWTREDDTRGGRYRPIGYNLLRAGLDERGNLTAWEHSIASPAIMAQFGPLKKGIDPSSTEGAANLPYRIKNIKVSYANLDLPFSLWWWRSVGSSQNAFVTECFMDEVAHHAQKDPATFRLNMLSEHQRHKKVLEVAIDKAGWGKKLPEGHAQGLAVHESFGSFVAQVAELSLEQDGTPVLHKITCAVDCGTAIHPDSVASQMSSGIVYGLSAALYGQLTSKRAECSKAILTPTPC